MRTPPSKHIKHDNDASVMQVPTQAPSEESGQGAGGSYCELLYAHLLDADGARLTYTHYTSRVPFRHLLDIMFNRPVYIQRNKVTTIWSLNTILYLNALG